MGAARPPLIRVPPGHERLHPDTQRLLAAPGRTAGILRRFFAPLGSLPFHDRCADEAGVIRLDLERSGRPIGPNDLLIAATARAYDLVLVTHDTREFGRIPGLRIEDWEEGGRPRR
jgi:predicted nucleic acid-binding protein